MWTELLHGARALFRRARVERELDDELLFHLEQQVEKLVQQGLPRHEAERRARLAFGGIEQVKEESRDTRGTRALETTLQDLRYGLRMLKKSPGFTAAVVLSLGLGIGANTAIFSLIDAVMLRMLPVRDPQQLYLVGSTDGSSTGYGWTYQQYRMLRDDTPTFAALAAYSPVRLNVGVDGSVEPTAAGQLVSGNYFATLGVNAVAGRTIGPEDDRIPDAHPVAMLGHGYWKRRFGQDPGVIGRTLSICGRPFTVIGVTPPEFFGVEVGSSPDIYVPLMMQPTVMPASENWLANPALTAYWLRPLGRLRPGVGAAQATAILDAWLQRQIAEYRAQSGPRGKTIPDERLVLHSAATGVSELRRQFSQSLFILMSIVGLVLVIACANVANLLLARAAARGPEFAVRLSLGAGRLRLTRQLLMESVLLAGLGGVCGIVFSRWAAALLLAFLSAGRAPIVLELGPDFRVLAFTAVVSLLTGVFFGLVPALRAGRIDPGAALKGRPGGGRIGVRPGRALVVSQVASCVLLLFGAGLFVRSLQKLDGQDTGFDRERVLMLRVEPRGSDQRGIPGTVARLDRTYRELLQRVEAIPGVRSASLAHFTPTSRIGFSSPLRLPSGEEASVGRLMVYPKYFATMGIPIVAGRDFGEADTREDSPLVAVVNEAFVRKLFPGQSAVGQQYLTRAHRRQQAAPCEIIGVVRDTRYASLRGETPPVVYEPFFQTNTGRGQMVLHVRAEAEPAAITPSIRAEVQRIDSALPLHEVRSLATEMDAVLVRERLIAILSGFFSLLALLLACVGLYGLLAFSVVQRTAEVGLRIALGARRADVLWMVMREGLVLVLLGILIGAPAALALARLAGSQVQGLLFGLQPTDLATLLLAALAMIAAAALAGYLPARRASRVDPLVALRSE
jgi:predicted permease